MEMREELKKRTGEVEAVVESYLPKEEGHQKTIFEAMNYSVRAGGKRLRPMLMQETYHLFGGTERAVEPFMAAMEMIHTSSLIHDDLPCMDNDELRRGLPTTWKKFGYDMAVLAGDALMIYAFETAAKAFAITAHPDRAAKAIQVLAEKTGIYGMIGGQVVDVELTGKPILKLTNKDYNENGLSELLALYGSAYNVNIKIFNDLQHTITGWPGGKPNADDTYRPERAKPYPKRVIVFSPHPDDDVISMGGTIRRLVEQKHDVHVAYETSGNIAVGDEEVIRFLHFINGFNQLFNNSEDQVINEKYTEIRNYLKDKKDGDMDTRDILTIKGLIRRGEARTACTYNNIPLDHCHFLDLPFYETGKIQKNPISEADVEIVRNLLREVKPHQIFVAGDLADPHGTHRVCTDAVFAAIDLEKEEGAKWLKDCRIWMYRGAWAEWEIENIEMAVPISPEELRAKRNSILKHQSQMESAPFLGNDERLFWQRSEDRNRGTAALYDSLGLASYEAMEAFVEYIPL